MMPIEIRHAHLFCGLGGGAAGFNLGAAKVGETEARMRCIGGIDFDAASCADFGQLAGVPATCLDLFDRAQYIAWHGHEPPADWRECTTADIHRAFGNERPHIVFTSPPCKGFSGLMSETKSRSDKYQALNALTLRGIWLTLEAYADDPPEFFILENVPRIATRGRPLLDAIESLLVRYGYAVAETTHDCGELGGLAQSRRRFLLVARHQEKIPPFLYEPPKRDLRGVGEVLERLPLPGDLDAGGPMHRLPRLQWRTWLRLAFVEAGSDWRSLERLAVEDGALRDYGIVPEIQRRRSALGVLPFDAPSGAVCGESFPSNGRYAVADPRPGFTGEYGQYGVKGWDEVGQIVTGKAAAGSGRFSVADPRISHRGARFNNVYRIVRWDQARPSVTGGGGPTAGGICVADPRDPGHPTYKRVKYRVARFDQAALGVIAASSSGNGAFAVADPRMTWGSQRPHYQTGGHYGVVPWDGPAYSVPGHAKHDRGRWSVADPRLPDATEKGVYVIRALDDTWHRPFTTLELAALQGLVDPEDPRLELEGASDTAWRERIGNAVPAPAAAAIASTMAQTLLLAWSGITFALGATPIWVRPIAIALSTDTKQTETPCDT